MSIAGAAPTTVPPRPGRPRSERARVAVLDAAAELLIEGGWAAATIEAIALRAGVSKVTIYKWWPSRGAVAVEGYFRRYKQTIVFEDSGDAAADLTGQIRTLLRAFRGRAGEVMAELIGQAQTDAALGELLRTHWLQPRREATLAVVERGISRGQIRAGVDRETVIDQLYAPIYYRLLMGHQPLGDSLAAELVDTLMAGIRPE